jgi:hypothetical protein
VSLSSTPWTLWLLILHCPRLRRVVLNCPVEFDAVIHERGLDGSNSAEMQFSRPGELHSLPQAVGDKVHKLVLYKSEKLQ